MICGSGLGVMRQAVLLVVLLSVAVPVVAQSKHKPEEGKSEEQRPASDAHSFMELFGKLERDWGLAAEKKDQKSLNEIMADEFIERDATDRRIQLGGRSGCKSVYPITNSIRFRSAP